MINFDEFFLVPLKIMRIPFNRYQSSEQLILTYGNRCDKLTRSIKVSHAAHRITHTNLNTFAQRIPSVIVLLLALPYSAIAYTHTNTHAHTHTRASEHTSNSTPIHHSHIELSRSGALPHHDRRVFCIFFPWHIDDVLNSIRRKCISLHWNPQKHEYIFVDFVEIEKTHSIFHRQIE